MESRLEQDLSCPICHELFRDPVVLTCSHSFCKVCLENWWEDKPLKTCPVCKRRSSRDNPPKNLALKNLVETFTEEKGQTAPAAEQTSPSPQQPECSLHEAAAHISLQTKQTQTQIRAEFEKLHQFLRDEEESRMKALREEEEQKIQNMKDKMAALSKDMEALSKTISETEEQLRAADASFLLQYKTAEERLQRCPLVEEPQMEDEDLIDQAKHLGNLGFNIWMNMKELVQFFPVVLDPNTAAPDLILSEDLTSVRKGEKQKVPKNSGRYNSGFVRGSETFVSGTHSWEVEVGASEVWSVGVFGHVQRGADTEFGSWSICFTDGKYSVVSPPDPDKRLSVKNLQRVRVKLDFDTKTLTFTDPDTNTVLHTVTDSFTEILPGLITRDAPLKISPKSITVTV